MAPAKASILSMPWTYAGNVICAGIGFFVGERFHADDRLPFVDDLHAQVDSLFRPGSDLHGACAVAHWLEHTPFQLQHDLHGLRFLEFVVNVGREDDFVLLDEEPRSLKPDEQVLGSDDLRLGLADSRSRSKRPGLDLPGRQAVGQREVNKSGAVSRGHDRGGPERSIGEVRADGGLDGRLRFGLSSRSSLSYTAGPAVAAIGAGAADFARRETLPSLNSLEMVRPPPMPPMPPIEPRLDLSNLPTAYPPSSGASAAESTEDLHGDLVLAS